MYKMTEKTAYNLQKKSVELTTETNELYHRPRNERFYTGNSQITEIRFIAMERSLRVLGRPIAQHNEDLTVAAAILRPPTDWNYIPRKTGDHSAQRH